MRIAPALLLLAASVSPALAQHEPVIVIPGKAGVPVLMNGVDISWSVVEGDFGLDRPIGMTPTVVYRPLLISLPAYLPPGPSGPGYFPRTGRKPGYGRLEVIPPPNRPLPPPAPSYYRSWSSESAPGPVTDYTPYNVPAWVDVYAGAGWWGRRGRHPGGGPGSGHGNK